MELVDVGKSQLTPSGGILAIGTYRDPLRAYLRYGALKPKTNGGARLFTSPAAPMTMVRRAPDEVMSAYMPAQGSGLIGVIELFTVQPFEFESDPTMRLVLTRPISVPLHATVYGDGGFDPTELPVERVTSTEMILTLPSSLATCSAVAIAIDGT
jgi:hypothetical protein